MLFSSKKKSISYASFSQAGTDHRNEDSVLTASIDDRFCFVVADGLGGHEGGADASKLVTDVFAQELSAATSNRAFIQRAFDRAQEEIHVAQNAKGDIRCMRTTAVVLSVIGNTFAWGHVGDSRLYHYEHEVLLERTKDHSVPQVLVDEGVIKESEIATHPDRARLLCAVGDKWDVPKYEISKVRPLRSNSAFLLCSDGLWEVLAQEMLAPPLCGDAQVWLSILLERMDCAVKSSNSERRFDDYSAVVVIIK